MFGDGPGRRAVPRLAGVCGGLACIASSPPAGAQSAQDKALADGLFEEGKRLVTAERYSDACPKFAESQRLDPGIGTLLYLGDCYEKNGQSASAWTTFREAAAAARAAGQADRESIARERAGRLEPKLSRLTIAVPAASRAPGLEIRRGGDVVGPAAWGSPFPVDPGGHIVDATAPGLRRWSATVRVDAGAANAVVTVPPLEADGSPAASGPAPGGAPGSASDSGRSPADSRATWA